MGHMRHESKELSQQQMQADPRKILPRRITNIIKWKKSINTLKSGEELSVAIKFPFLEKQMEENSKAAPPFYVT